ncbi:FAD dependent oxidoreductase [Xylona heveae TC161]|uniref:FAD dependent oxidoreductase n=1 Tax=Xylona heveae (strain CBS 132557 / TC161) TaxID=1328760 RepID=A0A165HU88_XYLHT|nr:FAD dependent oxidoreductase [Xylona heveae TC161]KZF23931.1 FAD dependent oxidoreductase [Xylona heveae TC161]
MASRPLPPSKDAPIVIIGAGIFGLSTSIQLAQRGYTNVTVIDHQPYDVSQYSYDAGCDAASADINKIFRSAYGSQTVYQDMSLEATNDWNAWNAELASMARPPPGLTNHDELFVKNGNVSITDQSSLPDFELQSYNNISAAGLRNNQVILTNDEDVQRAKLSGYGYAVDPFGRKARGHSFVGLLDMGGGFMRAAKACRFALHKARQSGVNFILSPKGGRFESYVYAATDPTQVTGVRTADGNVHNSALTIVAAGGWTPTLVPELDGLCETTAGTVVMVQLPVDSPLYARYAPENFPSWSYKMRDGAAGGLYGFPRDENGVVKIGYRGTKFTNPQIQPDGKIRSTPVTRWTAEEKITTVPKTGLDVIRKFIQDFMPDILDANLSITKSRICWYNDSYDNHFVVDHVPGKKGLMVATGGSGHAFKFLPNIGKYIVDVVEGKGLDRALIKHWKWRALAPNQPFVNKLMEGYAGARVLSKQELLEAEKQKLANNPRARI